MTTRTTRGEARIRLPRGERRALLLAAALAAFSDKGFHATAMDDIAERAGVSKPVLYQHFDSKLELYVALAAQVCDDIVRTIEGALESTADNGERIAACLHAYFEFVDRPASGYPLVFSSDMGTDPAVAPLLEGAGTRCGEAIGRVLQDETELGWDECVLLGNTLVGMAQAAARHWVESGSSIPLEHAVRLVSSLSWKGMGSLPQTHVAAPSRGVSGSDRSSG